MSKKNRRRFLLRFFNKNSGTKAIKLNEFVLFKHWNGDLCDWTVDIFSKESWKKLPGSQKHLKLEKVDINQDIKKAEQELEQGKTTSLEESKTYQAFRRGLSDKEQKDFKNIFGE